jgi:hypothetical protein
VIGAARLEGRKVSKVIIEFAEDQPKPKVGLNPRKIGKAADGDEFVWVDDAGNFGFGKDVSSITWVTNPGSAPPPKIAEAIIHPSDDRTIDQIISDIYETTPPPPMPPMMPTPKLPPPPHQKRYHQWVGGTAPTIIIQDDYKTIYKATLATNAVGAWPIH